MAYDIDAVRMLEVLRIGREKLSDKGTTSAVKRVDPLRSQTGLAREAVIEHMVETFRARHGGLARDALRADELARAQALARDKFATRSEEHTSELQSLMRISYAVFCLKKQKHSILNITGFTISP